MPKDELVQRLINNEYPKLDCEDVTVSIPLACSIDFLADQMNALQGVFNEIVQYAILSHFVVSSGHLIIQTHSTLNLHISKDEANPDQTLLTFLFTDDPSLDNNDPLSPDVN